MKIGSTFNAVKNRTYTWFDKSGQVYEGWTVLSRSDESTKDNIKWNCHCECGNLRVVSDSGLASGKSTNCGCRRKQKLIGSRFSMWTVIDGPFVTPGKRTHWLCLCDCGKQKLVEGHSLSAGANKCCGCKKGYFISQSKKTHGLSGSMKYTMFQSAKTRAKEKNVEFSLSLDDIQIPDTCPLLEIPISKSDGVLSGSSPSLDRIIPEKGYIKGNIQVISYKANAMKQGASLEELQTLVRNLEIVINGPPLRQL